MNPTNPILVEIPKKFINAIITGKMRIEGVRLKWVDTNQYAGFLQPTSPFSQRLFSISPSSGNPILGLINSGSGLIANVQLHDIKNILLQMQTMIGIGTAASIANLGISIGGFALVLNKLKLMHNDLKLISNKITDLKEFVKLERISNIESILEYYENSFLEDKSETRRIEIWKNTEKDCASAYNLVMKEMFHENGEEIFQKFSNDRDYTYEVIEKVLLFPSILNQARVEALLLLNEPITARKVNTTYQSFISKINYNPKISFLVKKNVYETDEKNINKLIEDSKNSQALINRLEYSLLSKDYIIENIIKNKINSKQFILEIRNNTEAKLLFFSNEYGNVDANSIKSSGIILHIKSIIRKFIYNVINIYLKIKKIFK